MTTPLMALLGFALWTLLLLMFTVGVELPPVERTG